MAKQEKNWWDSQSLWVLVGIVVAIGMELLKLPQEPRLYVYALIGSKVGAMAVSNIKGK